MRTWWIVVMCSITVLLNAAEGWITGPVDPVPLDQTVNLTIQIRHNPDEWPDVHAVAEHLTSKTLLGSRPFTLLDSHSQLEEAENGTQLSTFTYKLEPWNEGTLHIIIPPIVIRTETGEQTDAIWLDPVTVRVTPVDEQALLPPNTHLLRLTGGPLLLSDPDTQSAVAQQRSAAGEAERNVRTVWQRSFPWRLLLSLGLLGALVWWFQKYLADIKRMFGITNSSVNCPRLLALQALDYLAQRSVETAEEIDLFYIELTQIVRQFIEDEYGIHAPEHTTEEFLIEARTSSVFTDETQERLKELLLFGDLVKFADLDATIDQCNEALESAREFVDG